jgi:uncharacterized protein YqhQ
MPPANAAPPAAYGGQAVIEGVLMRGVRYAAVACRAPDGEIVTRAMELPALIAGWHRRIPLLRGVLVLFETIGLGMRALRWSAAVQAGAKDAAISGGSILPQALTTIALVGAIFFLLPVILTAWVGNVLGNEYFDVLAEGLVRLGMLVAYVALLGRADDVRRLYQYHAAEHRTIHAHEAGGPLTLDNIRRFPNAHARCGTAFLLTVMILSLLLFLALGTPPISARLIERILLVPVVAAIAYEVLRLGQRFSGNTVVAAMYAPNLWLQRLTTRDPGRRTDRGGHSGATGCAGGGRSGARQLLDVLEVAGPGTGVADGLAQHLHPHEQRVVLAVGLDGAHLQVVAAGRTLVPNLLAAAAPEHDLALVLCHLQRLRAHVAQHQDGVRLVILDDGWDQTLRVVVQHRSAPGVVNRGWRKSIAGAFYRRTGT